MGSFDTKAPPHLRPARPDVIRREARHRGWLRELWALQALTDNPETIPAWCTRAERASVEEDKRGIDIVVHTDVGKLYLQIKGSTYAVDKYLETHRKGNVVPFIVRSGATPESLRNDLLRALLKERERIIARRSERRLL